MADSCTELVSAGRLGSQGSEGDRILQRCFDRLIDRFDLDHQLACNPLDILSDCGQYSLTSIDTIVQIPQSLLSLY